MAAGERSRGVPPLGGLPETLPRLRVDGAGAPGSVLPPREGGRPQTLPDRIASRLSRRRPRRIEPGLPAAAVLVLLAGWEPDYRLVLTRRARTLRRQPGDFAFPGGMVEPGDDSALAAALREGREEIGLDPRRVRVLGRLDERRTYHGFRLSAFAAAIGPEAALAPGPEVEEIFEVPWRDLPALERTSVERLPSGPDGRPRSRVIFRYPFEGRDIWGLTARLIRDLLDVAS